MTAAGFADAIRTRKIRTVINLMEDNVDPNLPAGYFDTTEIRESELCAALGAKMINLTVDLIEPNQLRDHRPAAIGTFLELMDRPEIYPVLIHCRAGLHRTGVMVAIYRMEYEGWTRHEAMSELRAHGFGDFAATAANDYINQYVLRFEPRASSRVADGSHASVPGRLMKCWARGRGTCSLDFAALSGVLASLRLRCLTSLGRPPLRLSRGTRLCSASLIA